MLIMLHINSVATFTERGEEEREDAGPLVLLVYLENVYTRSLAVVGLLICPWPWPNWDGS